MRTRVSLLHYDPSCSIHYHDYILQAVNIQMLLNLCENEVLGTVSPLETVNKLIKSEAVYVAIFDNSILRWRRNFLLLFVYRRRGARSRRSKSLPLLNLVNSR